MSLSGGNEMTKEAVREMKIKHFSSLEQHFARKMLLLAEQESPELELASALLCRQASRGHVCLDLEQFIENKDEALQDFQIPSQEEWTRILQKMAVVGSPGAATPLILEEHEGRSLLYLNRYWQYENRLVTQLLGRFREPLFWDESLLQAGLAQLFPQSAGEEDLQRKATEMALRKRFCIISGGPGTGKTTIVIKILALLIQQDAGMRIAIVAPTGKAAARLQDSVLRGKDELTGIGLLSKEESALLPAEASTIHRLLGSRKNSVYFHHDHLRPLPLDCLVVDEASMVDLALMSKLVDALPLQARLILVGDQNQLTAVEAGSVLTDLCEEFPGKPQRLRESILHLQKSHRFDEQKGIGRLSREINRVNVNAAWNLLRQDQQELKCRRLPSPSLLHQRLREEVLPAFRAYLSFQKESLENLFDVFRSFMVLSPLQRGPYGSQSLNRILEAFLREEKCISEDSDWYPGRPLMILRNDYDLQLYNGDIGIVWQDPGQSQRMVYFEKEKGGSSRGFRAVTPARLPEHETLFAMTVHKSQGSEFDKILLILPDSENEILTRELLYTGITRARNSLTLWTEEAVFKKTAQKRSKRSSGLQEKLRQAIS